MSISNFNDIKWKGHINISKEQWINLLRNSAVFKEEDIQLLKLIYISDDFMATASQLAQVLNMDHFVPLNSQVGRLGKRIVKELKIEAPKREDGSYRWWNVPFWGSEINKGFYWIIRLELKNAMEEIHNLGEIQLDVDIKLPDEISSTDVAELYEGAKTQIYVNRYERNIMARNICIKYYGARCVICGFDFEKMYGVIGNKVIHVHHIKPLHEIGEDYRVDPIKDLKPVCPNCHLVIHKRQPVYSIEEVKEMLLHKTMYCHYLQD